MSHPLSRLLLCCLVLILSAPLVVPAQGSEPFGLLRLPVDFRNHRETVQEWMEPGATVVLSDVPGEGCLRHFWTTFNGAPESSATGMLLVLRVYTDGSERPDVEIPVSAYFAQFHDRKPGAIDSPVMQVTDNGGMNSYFAMPFQDGMRITLENQTGRSLDVYFQGDFHLYDSGTLVEERRFHAAHRRVNPAERHGAPYLIGHGRGEGFLAGISLGMQVSDRSDAWYHNGGDLILIDGGTTTTTVLSGIGGEDFFGNAYGMKEFSSGPIGSAYYDVAADAPTFLDYGEGREDEARRERERQEVYLRFSAHRFFTPDPIIFKESFVASFGAFRNDISSVLYWYEKDGDGSFVSLLPVEARAAGARVADGQYDLATKNELSWNVCGPFPCASREEFERKEFPEERIDFAEEQPADFGFYQFAVEKGRPATMTRWHKDQASILGWLDLRPFARNPMPTNFAMPKDASAYALALIPSREDRAVRLAVTHDDWLRIWLNGELVHDGEESFVHTTSMVSLSLKAGENSLLVKSANKENRNLRAWAFYLGIEEIPVEALSPPE